MGNCFEISEHDAAKPMWDYDCRLDSRTSRFKPRTGCCQCMEFVLSKDITHVYEYNNMQTPICPMCFTDALCPSNEMNIRNKYRFDGRVCKKPKIIEQWTCYFLTEPKDYLKYTNTANFRDKRLITMYLKNTIKSVKVSDK
jgi:hypothetical protein